jgi:hypothetical protein
MKIIQDNYHEIKETKCQFCESILAVSKDNLEFGAECNKCKR